MSSTFTRRELIKTGIGGIAVLAIAGCARSNGPASGAYNDPGYSYAVLSPNDRAAFAAIGTAMLDGALPSAPAAHAAAVVQVVRGVDVAIAGLTPAPQAELQQLLGLLSFGLTRGFAAGIWSSWDDASTADVAKFLESWRFSSVMLLQTGYQALHALVMASWYGNSESWARIGYPGPPSLQR